LGLKEFVVQKHSEFNDLRNTCRHYAEFTSEGKSARQVICFESLGLKYFD